MSSISNIVIDDGKTPVKAHTFGPNGNTGTEANYVDRSGGISVGFPTLKTNLALAGKGQPLNKIRVRMNVPVLETISGSTAQGVVPAPRLAYSASFDLTLIVHERSTTAERKDLRAYLRNLLADPAVVDLIDNLTPVY